MATITREDLYKGLDSCSVEFVPLKDKVDLLAWARTATQFNLADWDKCPLDQIGAVSRFERSGPYREERNTEFQNEASEIDARVLPYVKSNIGGHLDAGLAVYVVG